MSTIPRVITYEEWLSMPAVHDGVDEIVGGQYRLVPPARYAHAEILRRLNRLFDRQVVETKVAIYDSNLELLVSRNPLICRSPETDLRPTRFTGVSLLVSAAFWPKVR